MKFLANENFPLMSIKILKQNGFDIISVGQEFSGIEDKEVIDIAIKENRIILTFDRDYGELVFKKGYIPKAGIIYIRWNNYLPHEPADLIQNLLLNYNISFEYKLTVVSENNIRQRKF